jgi:hypothetical protein
MSVNRRSTHGPAGILINRNIARRRRSRITRIRNASGR